MKKTLSLLLALLFLLTWAVSASAAVDTSAFEGSEYYHYDRFDKTWSIRGEYAVRDSQVDFQLAMLYSSQLDSMNQPFIFKILLNYQGAACQTNQLDVIIDDAVQYSFSDMQYIEFETPHYAVLLCGSVLRDMLGRLATAEQVAYRIKFSHNGGSMTMEGDYPASNFRALAEVNALFEQAGLWEAIDEAFGLESMDGFNKATRTALIADDGAEAGPAEDAAAATVTAEVAASGTASAEAAESPRTAEEIDLSGLSYEELVALSDRINLAMWNSETWQEVTVPQGLWRVGEDIPAGKWTVKTAGTFPAYLMIGSEIEEATQEVSYSSEDYLEVFLLDESSGSGMPSSYTFNLTDGQYFQVSPNGGPVIFTPDTGKPRLGFK